MSKINYKASSPYSETQQTSWFLSNMTYRAIPRDGTDKLVIIENKHANRPDLLSFDLYGTPNFWWIFMIVNPNEIKDPIYDMNAGLAIYVPSRNRLLTVLGV